MVVIQRLFILWLFLEFSVKTSQKCADACLRTSRKLIVVSVYSFSNSTFNEGDGNDDDYDHFWQMKVMILLILFFNHSPAVNC